MKLNKIHIRDPFILPFENKYYLYGSKAPDYESFDVYVSDDLTEWSEPKEILSKSKDFWAEFDFWAPEVHYFKGRFYMFATFKAKNKCRACHILVSDTPDGRFAPIADSPVTPSDWECLDGTPYIDKNGKPHLVFCHEWVQVHDGEMCEVELSDDFSRAVSKPRVLWKASEYKDVKSVTSSFAGYVTDGPFLYRCENGDLLSIWSSFNKNGYTELIAKSDNGDIDGNWTVLQTPLSADKGGHGMIFRTFNNELKFVMHQPNNSPFERAVILPLEDKDGNLILKGI